MHINRSLDKRMYLQNVTYEKLMLKTNTVISHVKQEDWVPIGMENQERKECEFVRVPIQIYRKSLEAHTAAFKN